jgi:hypothetical protein
MSSPLPRDGGGGAGLTNQNAAKAAARMSSTTRVDFFLSSGDLGVVVEFISSLLKVLVLPLRNIHALDDEPQTQTQFGG